MDKALALESSGPGSNPCEGEILFTEEAWKKWARFVIYKKVNKEKGGNHYQTDFTTFKFLPKLSKETLKHFSQMRSWGIDEVA